MNKAWILLILAVVLAAQWTFISSFKSVNIQENNVFGTSAVIVSKAPYMYLRVHIDVSPNYHMGQGVSLLFSNGSQKEINDTYSFEVFLPKTDKNMGSLAIITPGEGVYVTNSHPINAAVVKNVTDNFFSYGIGTQYSDKIDIYWFKVVGYAHIYINGLSVGT
jgi:hypothetical protein